MENRSVLLNHVSLCKQTNKQSLFIWNYLLSLPSMEWEFNASKRVTCLRAGQSISWTTCGYLKLQAVAMKLLSSTNIHRMLFTQRWCSEFLWSFTHWQSQHSRIWPPSQTPHRTQPSSPTIAGYGCCSLQTGGVSISFPSCQQTAELSSPRLHAGPACSGALWAELGVLNSPPQ